MIPNLREIQRRFPLGNLELDDQARRQMNVVVAFRNLFTEPLHQFSHQTTTDELNERIEADNRENDIEEMTQLEHDLRVFQFVSDIMVDEDSNTPGLDVLIADSNFQAQRTVTESSARRLGHLGGAISTMLIEMVEGHKPMVPFGMIQCSVHGAIHYLFHYIVGAAVYRRYPDIRFPVHRLLEYNVDVPDGSTVPQVIITGYNTTLLMRLSDRGGDIVPDTIPEDFFNDDDDKSDS